MAVQDTIKKRRLELELTLKDVAKALNVAEATVSRYESGDIQNMGIDKIYNLAKVLRCSPGYLMGWEDAPNGVISNDLQLSNTEKELIIRYRSLSAPEQAMILRSVGINK